jgi:hypothetical protein
LHETGQITYPIQLSYALQQLNVHHKYFLKSYGIDNMLNPFKFERVTREHAGIYAQDHLAKTNIMGINQMASGLLEGNQIVRTQRPTISELKQYIDSQKIPICLLNFDKFVGRENKFAGHYIILTDINDQEVLYHNTGPVGAGPNQKCSLERFQKAWNLCLFDWDLIVV